jgi:hypothetical protein
MRYEPATTMNGSVMRLQHEEPGSPYNRRSGRICDRLSIEVSEACDRFFKNRRMRTDFRWIARSLRKEKGVR